MRSLQPPRDKRDISMQWNISPLINCHAIARAGRKQTNKRRRALFYFCLITTTAAAGGVQPDK